MKKALVVVMVLMVAVLFAAISWAGPMADGITKMKSGMYAEAAEQFEIVIRGDKASGLQADSGNAEAHFLLGQCYAVLNNMDQARERFGSALMIDGKYRSKIAEFLEDTGWKMFDGVVPFKKDELRADQMFALAIHYDSARAKTIGRAYFEKGKRRPTNKQLFVSAVSYNPDISNEIGDFFWGKVRETGNNEDQAYNWERLAAKYNPRYRQTFDTKAMLKAERALETAIKEAKTPDTPGSSIHEDRRVFHKNEAIRFYNDAGKNGQAIVEGKLPELKRFSKGEHDLGEFNAGEQTPYWITTTVLANVRFSATNRNFKIVYKNGEEFRVWVEEDRRRINSNGSDSNSFKVVAVDSVGITLVVK